MAERYKGRVVRMHLAGGTCQSSDRLLAHLLDRTDGVLSYFIDPTTRTLTAYLDETHADDDALVRALVASGMYPTKASELGAVNEDEPNAC